ncbi:hypothetical protein SAY86_014268 [Trapa natans]|uniref:Uncharacterized protein n=1 Tax=Trapa natans TaxID=22666 RepID=A0AAN7KY11_TRANT|nr:hypothetical protein SAY86_014268 [Trapa natans]
MLEHQILCIQQVMIITKRGWVGNSSNNCHQNNAHFGHMQGVAMEVLEFFFPGIWSDDGAECANCHRPHLGGEDCLIMLEIGRFDGDIASFVFFFCNFTRKNCIYSVQNSKKKHVTDLHIHQPKRRTCGDHWVTR